MSFICVCSYNSTKKFHREVSSSMDYLSDCVCITVMVYCKLYAVVQVFGTRKVKIFHSKFMGFPKNFHGACIFLTTP